MKGWISTPGVALRSPAVVAVRAIEGGRSRVLMMGGEWIVCDMSAAELVAAIQDIEERPRW